MSKKILSVLLAAVLVVLSSCSADVSQSFLNPDFSEKTQSEIVNNIDGDTSLADTIRYAAQVDDSAQAYYGDAERTSYVMKNKDTTLVHSLKAKNNTATLYNNEGEILLENTFTSSIVVAGKMYDSDKSETEGRVNTTRLGEYYSECHIRDFSFNDTAKLDKTFHLYGDRLYAQFSLYSSEAVECIEYFGCVVKIPVDKISALRIKDKNGIHDDLDYDAAFVEYLAFDISDIGTVGFVLPSDGSVESAVTYEENGFYVVNFTASENGSINDINGNGGYENNNLTFGFRIYADNTHSFDGIDREATIERTPLENITVNGGNAEGTFLGYDSLSGAYLFSMKGTDFNTAYQNPDLQYSLPVTIENDSYNRNIYMRSMGDNGCLEAAAILDDTNTLVPVNVQVCKNFHGDGGEPFYSADDPQYGDSIFPVSLRADEKIDFTLLNLYQNWGKYPLKQLSSIEFHTSYYHLSTGTTESNCIAPYFVFGKDGWTLPDFRTASGIMWAEQPQFNSEGILKFMTYRDGKKDVYSEYVKSDITSVGQTYSDITTTYISDCGSYMYTLRHVEFPQTDENRTYYTLDVEFLEDVTFSNFRKNFDLFYFDGRFVKFNKASYVDSENEIRYVDVNTDKSAEYYTLGTESPYWGFYDITDDTAQALDDHFGTNFAMIIKNYSMVINGEENNVPLVFRDSSDDEMTVGALTLDLKKAEFVKGDKISIDLILLPWGTGTEENDENVINVRSDSALNPVSVNAAVGSVVQDAFIPVVKCENNIAEFTLKGGKGNIAVRVDGFTELASPAVYRLTDNGAQEIHLASSNGYDGYSVFYNDDGTYSFSFVYTAESVEDEYIFRLVQENMKD